MPSGEELQRKLDLHLFVIIIIIIIIHHTVLHFPEVLWVQRVQFRHQHGGTFQEWRDDAGSALPSVWSCLLLCQRAGGDWNGPVSRCKASDVHFICQFNAGVLIQVWFTFVGQLSLVNVYLSEEPLGIPLWEGKWKICHIRSIANGCAEWSCEQTQEQVVSVIKYSSSLTQLNHQ